MKSACTFLLFSVKLNSKCKKQDKADTAGPQRHSEYVVPGEAHGKAGPAPGCMALTAVRLHSHQRPGVT